MLLLLAGSYFLAGAQEYLPLPTSGAEWTRLYDYSANGNGYTQPGDYAIHYAPAGDTLLGTQLYTRLYASEGRSFQMDSAYYVGAYRTYDAQSWFWPEGAAAPSLLYDFSLQEGDTIDFLTECESDTDCPEFIVHSVETITLEDGLRRRKINVYKHYEGSSSLAFSWMEGIGSTLGLLNDLTCLSSGPVEAACRNSLLCYQQDGNLVYTDPYYFKGKCYLENETIGSTKDLDKAPVFNLYPNPASEFITVEMIGVSGLAIQPYRIFSTSGKVVMSGELEGQNPVVDVSQLSAGMYTLILPQRSSISIGRFVKTR
jgi:hypothetical protein